MLVIPNGGGAVLMKEARVFLIYGRQRIIRWGRGRGLHGGRAAIGYDHGYDGEVFYLGLALDPAYIEGWVEGCLERIGEDHPDEELLFRDLWDDETQREVVIESLQADCEVRTGRPPTADCDDMTRMHATDTRLAVATP